MLGKTALTLALAAPCAKRYDLRWSPTILYTEEDTQFLVRHQALPAERILGVEDRRLPSYGNS